MVMTNTTKYIWQSGISGVPWGLILVPVQFIVSVDLEDGTVSTLLNFVVSAKLGKMVDAVQRDLSRPKT